MEQVNSRELLPPEDKFSKRLPLYRVLALVLIALAVVTCSVQQILRRDGDPYLFVHAARLFMQGQDIYTIPDQHGAYYYYPPFFAFVNIPLTFLPTPLVVVLWSLASVFLLAWTMAAFYAGLTGQPFFHDLPKIAGLYVFRNVVNRAVHYSSSAVRVIERSRAGSGGPRFDFAD